MRLFIAIDLDDAARDAIASHQSRLGERLPRGSTLKWVKPAQMHLTLVFLGEVDDAHRAAVVAAVEPPLEGVAFDAAFGGLGVFPPRGAPRVLWVGVGEGADAIVGMQRQLADRIVQVGVELERRPFQPHLTLARWRESHPRDRAIVDVAPGGTIAALRIDHATLYRSQLSPAGSAYTPLARATLARSA